MKLTFRLCLLPTEPPARLVQYVKQAEAAGFECLWLADQVLQTRDVFCYMTVAAMSSTTLTIGPGTLHPFTRHFAVAVNAMRTLEEIAPGRTVLGLGTGGSYVGELGIKAARMADMRAVVELSRKLMRNEHVTSDAPAMPLQGAHFRFPEPRLIPIYIAATGNRMLALSGEIADGILVHVGAAPRNYRHGLERVEEGCAARSPELAPPQVSLYVYCSVSADPSRALAECRSGVSALLSRDAIYGELAGVNEAELEAIRQANARKTRFRDISEDTVARLAVSGTAEQCADKIAAVAEAGARDITFVLTGSHIAESLDAFGKHIVPRFT